MIKPGITHPLTLAALLAATAGLSACKPSPAPASEESAAASEAAPDAKPGVSAIDGRIVLPPVAGRPGVAYFTLKNATSGDVFLASVHIDGVGKAEMHQTAGGSMLPVDHVEIGPGASITFAPGGMHVMAFDIDDKLKPGTMTEMTLTFSDRDKLSLAIKVEAMGANDGMAGMSH